MGGDLPKVYREVLRAAVAPVFWFTDEVGPTTVRASGTMTFAHIDDHVFGVTALHVLEEYEKTTLDHPVPCFLWERPFAFEVIDRSPKLDLVTLRLPPSFAATLGRKVVPLPLGNNRDVVLEGRGIMLCGYPGSERLVTEEPAIDWGLFTALGVARHVTPDQISWKPDPAYHVPQPGIPALPPNQNLGGISGGPLVALFEKAGGHLTYHRLAGILVQANSDLELVIARRTDSIRPDGTIGPL